MILCTMNSQYCENSKNPAFCASCKHNETPKLGVDHYVFGAPKEKDTIEISLSHYKKMLELLGRS